MNKNQSRAGSPGPGPPATGSAFVQAVRALWKCSPDALVVTDVQGTIRAANRAYCRRHGFPPAGLIGASLAVTFPAAERGAAMAHYRAVFASQATPDAVPAVARWQEGPEQATESRIAFATAPDGQTFMVASVRSVASVASVASVEAAPGSAAADDPLASMPSDMPSDLSSDRPRDQAQRDAPGPTRQEARPPPPGPWSAAGVPRQTAAELVTDVLKEWGIEVLFGSAADQPTRSAAGSDSPESPA